MFNRIHKGMYWDRALTLVEGCTPVDETCLNCWSAAQSYIRSHQLNPAIRARHEDLTMWIGGRARFNGRIRLIEENLDLPLRTKKPTAWAVWNDLFHDDVPWDYARRALENMAKASQHVYFLLTKRAGRMRDVFEWLLMDIPPDARRHIWPGVTVGLQKYDHRIEDLVNIDAAVRWLSIEPCLGPIELQDAWLQELSLIVLGGETGHDARPMHPDWPGMIRDHCLGRTDMGRPWALPFYFKGWGEWCGEDQPHCEYDETKHRCHYWGDDERGGIFSIEIGKKAAGRLLDGREWNELPKGWL